MLRADQLRRLDALRSALIAVRAEEREAWVAALDGADAELAAPLRDMLHHGQLLDEPTDPQAPSFTAEGVLGKAAAMFAADAAAHIGHAEHEPAALVAGMSIGPYRLIAPLGEGGMGVVWRAERSDGSYAREVALKLPRAGALAWRTDERFARERDILASLEHPHIARLYDAGITAHGQPWLAMELVHGQPLVAHADARGLDVRQRVHLFLQVLQAVQHAHQRLVVHRDLKPANILVDDRGGVHLLDFGIAVLTDEGAAQLTQLGATPLTPRYASPEQVRRERVGTASDIYSLGVVLCELLCGRLPYAPAHESAAAMEQAILDGQLRRPSELADAGDRRTRRALRGDLDNIVRMALSATADQRYASADAFAADLQAWLERRPVAAHAAPWSYRARKFMARHRAAITASALVVAALAGGTALALWQAHKAGVAAVQAQVEARRAQAVRDFLVGLFDAVDPARAQGREPTVRELMRRSADDLSRLQGADGDAATAVRGALVDIQLKLADAGAALPLAEAQVAAFQGVNGSAARDTAMPLAHALVQLGRAQVQHGQLDAAVQTLQRARLLLDALPALPAHLAGSAPASAAASAWSADATEAALAQAHALIDLQRPAQAEAVLRDGLPRLPLSTGPDGVNSVRMRAELAHAALAQARPREAVELFRSIEPVLPALGAAHAREAAEIVASLAYAQWLVGDWTAAQLSITRALAELDRLLGSDNSQSVESLRTLITVLQDTGDWRAARRAGQDLMARAARVYGADDPETAVNLSFTVTTEMVLGDPKAALLAATRMVRMAQAQPEKLTPSLNRGMQRRQALAMMATGDSATALTQLERLAQEDKREGVRNGGTAATLVYLAVAQRLRGDDAACASSAGEAQAIWASRAPIVVNQLLAARAGLQRSACLARSQPALARQSFDAARAVLAKLYPATHPWMRVASLVEAHLMAAAGEPARAASIARQANTALLNDSGIRIREGMLLLD